MPAWRDGRKRAGRISASPCRGYPQRGGPRLLDDDTKALDDAPDMGLADMVGLIDADFDYHPTDEARSTATTSGWAEG